MKTTFTKMKVKKSRVLSNNIENKLTGRKTTQIIIEKHSFDKELMIPIYPAIVPETAFKVIAQCYAKGNPHAIAIYLLIITQLQRKEQENEVTLAQIDVMKHTGLSSGSVSKAFSLLEELGLIHKVGKTTYKVSPNMAWVGGHLEWAEELLALKTGIHTTENDIEISTISNSELPY